MLNLSAATQAFPITLSTYHHQHLTGLCILQQHTIVVLAINAVD